MPERSNAIIGVVTDRLIVSEYHRALMDDGPEDHGQLISPVDTLCGYRGSIEMYCRLIVSEYHRALMDDGPEDHGQLISPVDTLCGYRGSIEMYCQLISRPC
ncbi:helicase-like transcription factor [Dorcoceras hygrometricum]|uniref:Helicase-like transcription factor n=1 Tax=Dorcoceras hygrometricum TaxID=472368 RepID=A0A2Z7CMD7_9LAMI|nr:helicase-like transcription factor [Dorcoceras hygrometricum]